MFYLEISQKQFRGFYLLQSIILRVTSPGMNCAHFLEYFCFFLAFPKQPSCTLTLESCRLAVPRNQPSLIRGAQNQNPCVSVAFPRHAVRFIHAASSTGCSLLFIAELITWHFLFQSYFPSFLGFSHHCVKLQILN